MSAITTPDYGPQIGEVWMGGATHSMPYSGQMLDTANVPFDQLKQGDVVRYLNPWMTPAANDNGYRINSIIHRLVRKDIFGHWVAKGDNNDTEDMGIVTPNNYMGKIIEPIVPPQDYTAPTGLALLGGG
jgi:hypothetical protein